MRLITLVLSTLVLASPLAIGAASAQPAPSGQGDGGHGFLTPEQRAMMRLDQPRADWQSMTQDQRAAMRDQMRAKWEAMSDADKQKLKADLQAKWNALPPDQKQAIEQRIAERRAHWQNQGPGQQQ